MAEKSSTANGIHHSNESIEAQKTCFKHAAENLSEISKPDASSETALCNGCSKTMLSYIFCIQDMLDGLARKLSKNEDPNCCVQCLRQDSRHIEKVPCCPQVENVKNNDLQKENLVNSNGIANDAREPVSSISEPKEKLQTNQKLEKDASPTATMMPEPKRPRKGSSRRNSHRISREIKENGNSAFSENSVNRNDWQIDFLYSVASKIEQKYIPYKQQQENKNLSSNSLDSSPRAPSSPTFVFGNFEPPPMADSEKSSEHSNSSKQNTVESNRFDNCNSDSISNCYKPEAVEFAKPDDFINGNILNHTEVEVDDSAKSDYSGTESNSSHFEADLDDSSKSESLETEVENMSMKHPQDQNATYKNVESWRTLRDSFNGRVAVKDRKSLEAFVTICRNNGEALGCLVLGSSLLLSRTSRKLCVLVFDDVDPVFKESLSSIFHVVQHVRHLKSVDERNLDYLKQKNLEKLSIWNLVQFSKCVFLNPDCLVLRNCDDLFQHEELTAVPDIGWPDCFNAGVFVFTPAIKTLTKLVELSQQQGQNNEGDQILLNSYFNSWSSDIGNKLSFIYNLMRNASYTYGPAYERFGHNVRIVQFLGGSKPWEVKFFAETCQLDGNVDVHPKHVRFFSEWINTFQIAVLKLFPQDVYSYAFNQKSISAEDIGFALCFSAPYKGLDENSVKASHILPKRRTVSPFHLVASSSRKNDICVPTSDVNSIEEVTQKFATIGCIEQNEKSEETQNGKIENDSILRASSFDRCLPGSIIGDYHGMKAWEQGQMDYEGCDSSENIINRLTFLIHQSM